MMFQPNSSSRPCGRRDGFTLAEVLVSMAVFSLVVMGMVYAQLAGMKYDQLVQSKVGASESSRRGFELLTSEVRSSKSWKIGKGNDDGFSELTNGMAQVGSAIQLSLTDDTNRFVRYFYTNGCLCRMTSGASQYTIIADHLTNMMGFRVELYNGMLSSNKDVDCKSVLVTTADFAQFQFPTTTVGSNCLYDYYHLQFKVSSHAANKAAF